ncbi:hypothetical protein L9F63_008617, partial [Diploptera punctata]
LPTNWSCMKVVVFVILAINYPEFSAIKPLPLFSSARRTHLRLRPANNTLNFLSPRQVCSLLTLVHALCYFRNNYSSSPGSTKGTHISERIRSTDEKRAKRRRDIIDVGLCAYLTGSQYILFKLITSREHSTIDDCAGPSNFVHRKFLNILPNCKISYYYFQIHMNIFVNFKYSVNLRKFLYSKFRI